MAEGEAEAEEKLSLKSKRLFIILFFCILVGSAFFCQRCWHSFFFSSFHYLLSLLALLCPFSALLIIASLFTNSLVSQLCLVLICGPSLNPCLFVYLGAYRFIGIHKLDCLDQSIFWRSKMNDFLYFRYLI